MDWREAVLVDRRRMCWWTGERRNNARILVKLVIQACSANDQPYLSEVLAMSTMEAVKSTQK